MMLPSSYWFGGLSQYFTAQAPDSSTGALSTATFPGSDLTKHHQGLTDNNPKAIYPISETVFDPFNFLKNHRLKKNEMSQKQ